MKSPKGLGFLYALHSYRTLYIGYTLDTERRYREHVEKRNTPATRGWIVGLRAKGRIPEMTVLAVFDPECVWKVDGRKVTLEYVAIQNAKSSGYWNVLNVNDAGWPIQRELCSEGARISHAEKDEFGCSVHGVKNAERLHAEKDELGRSVNAVKGAEAMLAEKDEFGRSVNSVRGSFALWSNPNRPCCGGTNNRGKPCKAIPLTGTDYCHDHT